MVPLGMLAGAEVSVGDMLVKNFIPTTLGNTIAGALIVAGGYSFAFGRLGRNNPSPLPLDRVSRENLRSNAENPPAAKDTPAANSESTPAAKEICDADPVVPDAAQGP